MSKNMNVPKLRFSEFSGEWEEKKLGSLGEFKGGGTPSKQNDEYWMGTIPWISSSDINDNDINTIKISRFINEKSIKESATKIIPKNSILFVSRVGVGKLAVNLHELCTSQDFTNFIPTDTNSYYLGYLFQAKKSILESFNQGTSIKGFTKNDIETLKISLPSKEEQEKIASFLTSVDTKIEQLTKKEALLQKYKKSVMSKIFNQEIRFKDDDGSKFPEWEEKRLEDVFYSEKGKGISKNQVVENGRNECILYGELYTQYSEVIFEIVSKTNSEDGIKSEIGDLLIPSSTTTTGIDLANITALNKANILLGGDITVLRSNEPTNNIFYAYYLTNFKKNEIASYAQGSTIVHLYYNHIKDMLIDFPYIKEQTKIANFLLSIDKKIELTTKELNSTKEFKKALLQQMFVRR